MGKRIIISESEKKHILSLYEQNENEYIKENNFLKKYIGKTFSVYLDKNYQTYAQPEKIKNISYDGVNIYITTLNSDNDIELEYDVECLYNPSRLSYKIDTKYEMYNKTLIDDIQQKGSVAGIKWCQKPKADFGTKSVNEDVNLTPPPSESVLVAKKNPFKYPEYESARRKYSPNLKDGDLFYVISVDDETKYINNLEESYNFEFIKNLVGKKARWDDKIIEFTNAKGSKTTSYSENPIEPPTIYETKNRTLPSYIGSIDIKINDTIKTYYISKSSEFGNEFIHLYFHPEDNLSKKMGIQSINELYTKEYYNKVGIKYLPDNLFEIRKIQRQQTDF